MKPIIAKLPKFQKAHLPLIFICLISVLFTVFLLSPVLLTLFQSPPKTVNMLVGHYYEDYYEYLSYVRQGQQGHLLLHNLFSHDDRGLYFTPWWPYALLGFTTYIFHLNIPPQCLYWIGSLVFISFLLILTFISISCLLPNEKMGIKTATFLLVIFATSLFKIINQNGLQVVPIDFWYSIGNPLSRYNVGTPHHQIAHLIFLLSMLLIIKGVRKNNLGKLTLTLIIFSLLLFSLSPPQLSLLWGSYFLSLIAYAIFGKKSSSLEVNNQRKDFIKKLIPLVVSVILVIPLIIFLKNYSLSAPAYIIPTTWDVKNLYFPPLPLFLLTTGPLLLLACFALPLYFKEISYPKLIFFFLAFLSFFITTIPISIGGKSLFLLLGFFNLRFNTPSSYIFLGVAAMLLLRRIFKKVKLIYAAAFIVWLLFLPSLLTIWYRNISTPSSASYLQYMPNELYQGIKFLEQRRDNGVVLTSPSSSLGLAVPALTGRRVFFGRTFFTLNLEVKEMIVKKFYALLMTKEEAQQFLKKENIKYVLIFRSEADLEKLSALYGLKLLSKNGELAILSPIL